MDTELIQLDDGLFVEIATTDGPQPISSKLAKKVKGAISNLEPVIADLCGPIAKLWKSVPDDVTLEEASVEVGVGFEAEGNIYVTKAKGSANLTVTLKFKPKP